MPKKNGNSPKRRKKSDKRRRNKDLYGKYSNRGGRFIMVKLINDEKSHKEKLIKKAKRKSKKHSKR